MASGRQRQLGDTNGKLLNALKTEVSMVGVLLTTVFFVAVVTVLPEVTETHVDRWK